MAKTVSGSSLSTRRSNGRGTAGATRNSKRSGQHGYGCTPTLRSRWPRSLGATTGRWSRMRSESRAGSGARGLLQEASQLLGPDRRIRRADARREQLKEAAQPDVVQHGRGFNDLGRGLAMLRIEDPAQAVGEVVRQLAHRLLRTINRCSRWSLAM